MATGLINVETNIQLISNASGLVMQTNRVKADLESIVIAVEMFVSTFIEIKDRGDKNLASRNILSLKNLKIMNIEANDIFHDLHPLFPNTEAENYYSIPISTTGYFPKDEAFKTIIHLPQMRRTDV